MHASFKFDHEKSLKSIAFLDTVVYNDKNWQLQATLRAKPTNTSIYNTDLTPNISKKPLPSSQTIRLRRICTDKNELKTKR